MLPILLSAEIHNFPSGVAPFPGAETGTGGRIRDVQARNAKVTASTVGYWVGVLTIPRLRAAVGGDSEWARVADPRDGRLERHIRSSSASR